MARVAETPVQVGDRSVLTLQLFHVAGMESAQTFLYAGATDVILKTFEPRQLLETIQEHRITDVQVVPTTLAALFNLPDFADFDLSSLRRIVYAASPMPVALLQKGMDLWGPIFCQFYGQTESGPMLTTLSRDEHGVAYGSPEEQQILLSVGHPCPGRTGPHRRRAGRRPPRRRGGRDHRPQQAHHGGVLAPPRGDGRRCWSTAGSTPATWPTPTSAATSTSWAARAT